jgi:hypothetical protein
LISGATGFLMKYYEHVLNFCYAIATGVVGSLLLVIFFSSVMAMGDIGKLLPFIIGFNAALTGYNLISQTKNRFKHKRMCGFVSGIIIVVIAVLALNIAFFYYTGGYLIYMTDFLFLAFIGGVFSWLGAVLAIKYLKLDTAE